MKWYFRTVGNRIGKLCNENNMKDKTEEQLLAEGYQRAETNFDMYKAVKAMGFDKWEEFCRQRGITVTDEELAKQTTNFDQGDIRRACRRLGIEEWLDAVINSSVQNQKDWIDEPSINLDDPRVATALAQLPITIEQIKEEISKDWRVR